MYEGEPVIAKSISLSKTPVARFGVMPILFCLTVTDHDIERKTGRRAAPRASRDSLTLGFSLGS